MLLSYETKVYFEPHIRSRGSDYSRSGLVRDLKISADGNKLTAVVKGSRPYFVELNWNPGTSERLNLSVYCSCPYYGSSGPCKHLWATILEASDQPFGKKAIHFGKMVFHGSAGESQDFDFDDGFEDLDEASAPVLDPYSSRSRYSDNMWSNQKPAWQALFKEIESGRFSVSHDDDRATSRMLRERQAYFGLTLPHTFENSGLRVHLYYRERLKSGEFGALRQLSPTNHDLTCFSDPVDQRSLSILNGLQRYHFGEKSIFVPESLLQFVLPVLIQNGRTFWGPLAQPLGQPLKFEEDVFDLHYDLAFKNRRLHLSAKFLTRSQSIEPEAVKYISNNPPIFITGEIVGHYNPDGPFQLIEKIVKFGPIICKEKEVPQFIDRVLALPLRKVLNLPQELGWSVQKADGTPLLRITSGPAADLKNQKVGQVFFRYLDRVFPPGQAPSNICDKSKKIAFKTDFTKEQEILSKLPPSTKTVKTESGHVDLIAPQKDFYELIPQLAALGWEFEVQGKKLIHSTSFNFEISSGVDWFDMSGSASFDGETYSIPEILMARERNSNWIRLKSGEYGMIPPDLLKRYNLVESLGEIVGQTVRFRSQHAFLINTLFESDWPVKADRHFREVIQNLKNGEKVKPLNAPKGFNGELRPYQKIGLGWLNFLKNLSLGGCLADDMGLGKTVQVLAYLELLKQKQKTSKPHLIVVPRSLIYNWQDESRKFTPDLRVLSYSGSNRKGIARSFSEFDLILTTYQTLRNDILDLKEFEFGYVILDEAQAIKNPQSQVSKAVKLLKAQNRLVMTGTPIENHFGDLLSIFQFLNPGLYSNRVIADTNLFDVDQSTQIMLKGLRPFILRRTKEEVLKDLPPKTEQTLFCEMSEQEKEEYERLRDYYRNQISSVVQEKGFKNSKIHVLEALLRLRQMASHPGLVDKTRAGDTSSKIETLLEQLGTIVETGHKVLVFSQFTSLLALVRRRIQAQGLSFSYLDGKTRDRQSVVEKFQNDPSCNVFLISLKAGGVGLNLTSADYCFILDPWWNPAVEAQAIDRMHRIGQKNKVVAYRMITKGTVEEKILELQSHKKSLSRALFSSDQGFLRQLKAEDLNWILS